MRGLDALQGGVIAPVVAQLFPVGSQDGLRVCILWQAQHLRTASFFYHHCKSAGKPTSWQLSQESCSMQLAEGEEAPAVHLVGVLTARRRC